MDYDLDLDQNVKLRHCKNLPKLLFQKFKFFALCLIHIVVAQEVDLSVGNGLGVGGKVYRKLGGRTFVNMSGTLQFARGGTRPAFSCSLGNYLDKHTGTAAFPDP